MKKVFRGMLDCVNEEPPRMSEEQIAFAFELNKQGMTYKMIEWKTGVSIATQKRKFKNYKNIL